MKVVEVTQPNVFYLCKKLRESKINFYHIGSTKYAKDITIKNNNETFYEVLHIDNLREFWEYTSNKLKRDLNRRLSYNIKKLRHFVTPLKFKIK